MRYADIVAETMRNGGATIDMATGTVLPVGPEHYDTDTYSVGHGRLGAIVAAPDTDTATATDYARVGRIIRRVSRYSGIVGLWIDGGRLYIDPVTVTTSLDNAVMLGREYNEKAIFNLRDGDTIRL